MVLDFQSTVGTEERTVPGNLWQQPRVGQEAVPVPWNRTEQFAQSGNCPSGLSGRQSEEGGQCYARAETAFNSELKQAVIPQKSRSGPLTTGQLSIQFLDCQIYLVTRLVRTDFPELFTVFRSE